jgi:hypothetical protein
VGRRPRTLPIFPLPGETNCPNAITLTDNLDGCTENPEEQMIICPISE